MLRYINQRQTQNCQYRRANWMVTSIFELQQLTIGEWIFFNFFSLSFTEKYNPETDTPKANPKMWKANFRCAINSLPDIEELRDRGKTKGNDAYKVYRLIPRTKATKLKSGIVIISKRCLIFPTLSFFFLFVSAGLVVQLYSKRFFVYYQKEISP